MGGIDGVLDVSLNLKKSLSLSVSLSDLCLHSVDKSGLIHWRAVRNVAESWVISAKAT